MHLSGIAQKSLNWPDATILLLLYAHSPSTVLCISLYLNIFLSQPSLLEELYNSTTPVPRKLNPDGAKTLDIPKKSYINSEAEFRYDFNENPMAVDKLAQGIRSFAADAQTLKEILRS